MKTALSAASRIRLEKAARDNGFDRELPRQGDWLGYASTQATNPLPDGACAARAVTDCRGRPRRSAWSSSVSARTSIGKDCSTTGRVGAR